jgi:hypothetical protein
MPLRILSTIKTDCSDANEIWMKVAVNTNIATVKCEFNIKAILRYNYQI